MRLARIQLPHFLSPSPPRVDGMVTKVLLVSNALLEEHLVKHLLLHITCSAPRYTGVDGGHESRSLGLCGKSWKPYLISH